MATIRTHTTLRTLFLATAVFAVLAAMWTARAEPLLLIPLTACGATFVTGLFGFWMFPAFLVGFVSGLSADTFYTATVPKHGIPLREAFTYAIDRSFLLILLFGLAWATAWWWGTYLRYVWSRPTSKVVSDTNADVEPYQSPFTGTWREPILARCEEAPVPIFIFTVFANIFIFMIFASVIFRIVPAR
jgi:hypothetical protein